MIKIKDSNEKIRSLFFDLFFFSSSDLEKSMSFFAIRGQMFHKTVSASDAEVHRCPTTMRNRKINNVVIDTLRNPSIGIFGE